MLRAFLVASICAVAAIASIRDARADQGVAINLGQIDIDDRLDPGGRYKLPTLTVTNTGDEPGEYEITLVYQKDDRQQPPGSWFSFTPSAFLLQPGESRNVAISIDLPVNADAGDYSAVIEARPLLDAEGVAIAGAAGSRVYFSVRTSGQFDAWALRIERWMDDNAPWSYWMPPLAVLGLALWLFRRKFRIRIESRHGRG